MNLKKLTLLCACVLPTIAYAADQTEKQSTKDPSSVTASSQASDPLTAEQVTIMEKLKEIVPPRHFSAADPSLNKILTYPTWVVGIFKGIYTDDVTWNKAVENTIQAASKVKILEPNLQVKYFRIENILNEPLIAKMVYHPRADHVAQMFSKIMEMDHQKHYCLTQGNFETTVNTSILLSYVPELDVASLDFDKLTPVLVAMLTSDKVDAFGEQISTIMKNEQLDFAAAAEKAMSN